MNRRCFRGRHAGHRLPFFYLLAALAFPLVVSGRAEAAGETAPNFVFILADDQSWSGTSVPMIPGKVFSRSPNFHTPNIERLAARGVTFSQAYASHCKCECSRASILMGRSTTSLNATEKTARNWRAPASESLANTLKRANPAYRAAHLGKWQWPQTPQSMGYDLSDGITQNEDGDTNDPEDPKQSFGITRRAHAFMEQQVRDSHPFYLQLSYYAVHPTAQALESTLKKYAGSGLGDRAVMAAMTEDLDNCVGRVLKKVEELGITNNTYILYMSDNGGRTRVLKGGKGNISEGGIRVPLIVGGPGIPGGVYCDEPVVGYDILPTVLDWAAPGFALPQGVEGGSWKPVLQNGGAGKVPRPINRLVFHMAVEVEHPQSVIRKGDLKLLYFWDTRQAQLFDLAHDLGEAHDLVRERPETALALEQELKAHVRAGLGDAAVAALERGERPQGPGGAGRPPAKKKQAQKKARP